MRAVGYLLRPDIDRQTIQLLQELDDPEINALLERYGFGRHVPPAVKR